MDSTIMEIKQLGISERIVRLKDEMRTEDRFVSIEQAAIITRIYRKYPDLPTSIKRAKAFAAACEEISIRINEGELIVGNRTAGIRGGVVSPESGLAWVDRELEGIPTRPQDVFSVRTEDIRLFREEIFPFWEGNTMEDHIYSALGEGIKTLEKVVKINQKDHAQGHICPNTKRWLALGPAGILESVEKQLEQECFADNQIFLESVAISLEGAIRFIERYAELAKYHAEQESDASVRKGYEQVSRICFTLSTAAPSTFHEAVQAMWFLFVLLQLESNASSFSPGRADQYLYPFFQAEMESGTLTLEEALELIEAVFLKFNQIVYLRNSQSARYFAGFPIGFNIAIGGVDSAGNDATNELSYLFLKAQEQIGLPQPNLSARLHTNSPDAFIKECARVIGKGGGMPQLFNDEAIIPGLIAKGISQADARDYAIVGCVELTTQGNNLGWSDAAMFNLVKVLELTLNNGRCLLSGERIGIDTGNLATYSTYEELEAAYTKQIHHYIDLMIPACEIVEKMHALYLPSPFLSSVIDDCIERGVDVTAGGATYNLSGIQAIQVANVADSMAVLKSIYAREDEGARVRLLEALRTNFSDEEVLRQRLLNKYPKYGNDVPWVDEIGNRWVAVFDEYLRRFTNVRGGIYHTGLYTVSAHVPMGQNVGATADGRRATEPLADGGVSAVYGRDAHGPTALLRSVARIDSMRTTNGALLNMKFLPQLFATEQGIEKFSHLLRAFVRLKIIHVQFNVLSAKELLEAQENPDAYRGLTVRVAGYTAYFTELARDLQNEIIERTSYGDVR